MKSSNLAIFIITILLAPCLNGLSGELKYSFTIVVEDEQGKPVQDAVAEFTFYSDLVAVSDTSTTKKTDSLGRAEFRGEANDLGHITIAKDGYYPTRDKLSVYLSSPYKNEEHQDFEPKNALVALVLKPKGKQVPMYAKVESIIIPGFADGKSLGYDLMIGDWVAPHGKGIISDFIWTPVIVKLAEGNFQWSLDLKFSEKGDGIITLFSPIGYDAAKDRGSALRSPTRAPNEGYLSSIHWSNKKDPTRRGYLDNIYVFRVRSTVDATGKVIGGLYGKIYYGPKLISNYKYVDRDLVNKGDYLKFTYFLNPDGTPNLEFDNNQNLITNLKKGQGAPGP